MTTIMMLALAVVLLLVAVGSLMSYIKERRGYKKTFKKRFLRLSTFQEAGVVIRKHSPCFFATTFGNKELP